MPEGGAATASEGGTRHCCGARGASGIADSLGVTYQYP